MKTSIKSILVLLVCAMAGQAMAQSVQIGSASGDPGETVSIPVTFTAGPSPDRDVTAITIIVGFSETYDLVAPTGVSAPLCGGDVAPLSAELCGWGSPGQPQAYQINQVKAGPFPSAVIARISFTIPASAEPGTVDTVFSAQSLIGGAAGALVPAVEVGSGTITVNLPPQPHFDSTPTAPGDTISMSGQVNTVIGTTLTINNDQGEDGSTLIYSCYDQINAPAATGANSILFTITGDVTDVEVPKGSVGTVSIGCDSTIVGEYTGTMICEHNGSPDTGPGASPVSYPLYCNVTAEPVPAFSGTATGLNTMEADEQGDSPAPMGTLDVQNTGDPTTLLSGTCTASGGDAAKFSVTNGGFTDLAAQADSGPTHTVMVSCDTSVESPDGVPYTSTLSCAHSATGSPATFPLSCLVGPPGPAKYESDPVRGSTIDLTPVEAAVKGDDVPDQNLVITNNPAEANDRDLVLLNCGARQLAGSSPAGVAGISWTTPTSPVAPYASTTVTFSCDTTETGDYSESYACDYDEDGDGEPDGSATYTILCSVRDPESEVAESPASESTLTVIVPQGGVGTGSVTLFESLDEGADATLESCFFDDGTNTNIVNNTTSQTIPSGGSFDVLFEASAAADGLGYTDVLVCHYTDSTDEDIEVFWYIEVFMATANIPTLSTWGLITMFLAMLGFGGIVARRRKLN